MRVVDLFAGCGGLSRGFLNAGFDVVAGFELWDDAIECYKCNFKHDAIKADLSKIDLCLPLIQRYKPNVIVGGPPCQDFSTAGKMNESSRAELTKTFAKIIEGVLPKYFLMENVSNGRKSQAYRDARDIFKICGYGLTESIVDCSYYGVPQRRKRFICIGCLGRKDGFMDNLIQDNRSSRPLTMRDYFGDDIDFEYYYRHPCNYSRRAIFSIDEPSMTIRGINRSIPKDYVFHPLDATNDKHLVHNLSTMERASIQTFPEDYIWVGNKTSLEKMIGNAVPVHLAEVFAKMIMFDSKNSI